MEIARLRVDATNVVRVVRVILPDLVPPYLRGSDLVGCRIGTHNDPALKRRLCHLISVTRKSGSARELDWESEQTGRDRHGVVIPHDDRSVTIRVFADADEAQDCVRRRAERLQEGPGSL